MSGDSMFARAAMRSSVGVLAMLGNRSNKAPSYPQFSMDDLRKLFVPDFGKTGAGAIRTLALAYDALSERDTLPLPRMDACRTRRALDEAVCAALGVDAETVSEIRRQLSREPSVTGKRYAGRCTKRRGSWWGTGFCGLGARESLAGVWYSWVGIVQIDKGWTDICTTCLTHNASGSPTCLRCW